MTWPILLMIWLSVCSLDLAVDLLWIESLRMDRTVRLAITSAVSLTIVWFLT